MTAAIHRWVIEPLSPEVEAALRRVAACPDVARVAVMPDVHLAGDVCVGSVIATRQTLLPGAIGGDIGCGVATVRFDGDVEWLADRHRAARVLAAIGRVVPAIRHRSRDAPPLPARLEEQPLSHPRLHALARGTGRLELGTLGRGNHFVELQTDEQDRLWLMVHSGSRAIGQAIRDHHEARAVPVGSLAGLDVRSPEGLAYAADLAWALTYAEENRRALVAAVSAVLAEVAGAAPDPSTAVSCHHNFARAELHDGTTYWVHRKGAISAAVDEPGLIPGSMGTASYHVAGRGHAPALCSSSHGAGRRFSRGAARRHISAVAVEKQLTGVWFDHRLVDGLRDEAPAAYRDIGRVMQAQRELTRIVCKVRPRLVYKAV